MDGGIIHDEDGIRLWPFTTMEQQLFNKIFKYNGISGSRVDTSQSNATLSIRNKNLKPLFAVKLVNLHGRCAARRPTPASVTTPFITARLVDKDKLIRLTVRKFIKVQFP